MKILSIVVILIVLVSVLGYFMGWFNVSSHNDRGNAGVTMSVNTDKLEADKNKVVDTAQTLGRKTIDTLTPTTQKSVN